MKRALLFSIWLFIVQASFGQTPGGGVTDIDGNSYATVIIGTQEWMAENLRTTRFANGDVIPEETNDANWANLTSGAWCHKDNDIQNDLVYGKLYNGYLLEDSRNVCPSGWHVPHSSEYTTLINYLGGPLVAGGKMKDTGTVQAMTGYWQDPNFGATNSSGFNGIPAGSRDPNSGNFIYIDIAAHFWACDLNAGGSPAEIHLASYYEEVQPDFSMITFGHTIRCALGPQQCTSVGLIELNESPRELIRIIDFMGRETENRSNTILIYIYSDGTTEKVFQAE